MPTFPEVLDDFTPHVDGDDDVMAIDVNELQTAIEAIEAKLGIDSSEDADSIDYILKNASSINPGHIHNFLSALDGNPNPAVYVDNNGNVGIGTTSPSQKLDINGNSGSTYARIYDTGANSNAGLELRNDAQRFVWEVVGTLSDKLILRDATSAAYRMAITTDGKVGIGTTSPSSLLDVNGTMKAITLSDGIASLSLGVLNNVKLGSLVSNGFIKTSGGDGTLSVDTNSYQILADNLTAIAGLTPASSLIIGDGLGSFEMITPANFITDNGIEKTSNKVTSISGASTDVQYPSAKLVYDQLALKAPSSSPTFTTKITGSFLTASEMLITNASKEIVSAPVATYPSLTELSYIKGLSSAVQTQINSKMANPMSAAGDIIYGGASGTPTRLAKGTDGQVLTLASGNPSWADASGGGGGVQKLAVSGTPTTVTGTTSETALCSFTVPGGSLGTGNMIRVYIPITSHSFESGGNGYFRIYLKYGSTTLADIVNTSPSSAASGWVGYIIAYVGANASTSAQIGNCMIFTSAKNIVGSALGNVCKDMENGTASENSTADKTLTISIQLNSTSGSNAITTGGYEATLIA